MNFAFGILVYLLFCTLEGSSTGLKPFWRLKIGKDQPTFNPDFQQKGVEIETNSHNDIETKEEITGAEFVQRLHFTLQELVYDMIVGISFSLRRDLVKAFGIGQTKNLIAMADTGSLEYLSINWKGDIKIMEKIKLLRSFCMTLKPKHPVIIEAGLTDNDYDYAFKLFHDEYSKKDWNCEILYHGECNLIQNYLNLPFVSVQCTRAKDLEKVKALPMLKRIDIIGMDHAGVDLRLGIIYLQARIDKIRHLSIDLNMANGDDLQSLVRLLVSPDNVLEALELVMITPILTNAQFNLLESAFKSDNLKITRLKFIHYPDASRQINLVRLVRGKVTKLEFGMPHSEDTREFFDLIIAKESAVVEIYFDRRWGTTEEHYILFFSELQRALKSPTNKIKAFGMKESHELRASHITDVLREPNNNLESITVDHLLVSDQSEMNDLTSALINPNCKLKYFGAKLPKSSPPLEKMVQNEAKLKYVIISRV